MREDKGGMKIVLKKLSRFLMGRAVLREYDRMMAGYCNICGEKYVGLAQDCRCTNYGRPS